MKKIVFNVALICSLMFLFSQCKKESGSVPIKKEGVDRGEIKLNSAELNIVPYSVNDSVIFKDSVGNTLAFKVEARNTTSGRMYKDGGTDAASDYYGIENLYVLLSDTNGYRFEFFLQAQLPAYCSSENLNKNYFIVSIHLPPNSTLDISHNSFASYIDSTNFYYTLEKKSIPYHASIAILNKTFSSVYELTRVQPSVSDDFFQTIYYNKSKGIVGFKTKKGKTWYLNN